MAMFGKKRKEFDWTGALLGFFNPDAAAMYNKKRAGRAEAEMEAEAIQDAYTYMVRQGMDHQGAMTAARDPQVRAHIVRDRSGYLTQNAYDPLSKQSIYAPSEREVDGVIVRTDSNGQSRANYETPYPKITQFPDGSMKAIDRLGIENINRGMGEGGAIPQPAYGRDPLAPLPTLSTRELEELERRGGAGRQGPRPFRPY